MSLPASASATAGIATNGGATATETAPSPASSTRQPEALMVGSSMEGRVVFVLATPESGGEGLLRALGELRIRYRRIRRTKVNDLLE